MLKVLVALIVFNSENKAEKEVYIQMNRDLMETIEIYLCVVVNMDYKIVVVVVVVTKKIYYLV